jgi:hypothetical protein
VLGVSDICGGGVHFRDGSGDWVGKAGANNLL